jgi:hypothetical protein
VSAAASRARQRRRLAAVAAGALLALAGAVSNASAEPPPGSAPVEASAGSSVPHHYEYVFLGGEMFVYDMDEGQRLVQEVTNLPDTDGVRGAMVNPATDVLYISHRGDGPKGGPEPFDGSLLAYDLVSSKVLWNREYEFPIDSGALSADGTKIYMPSGENEPSGVWNVLNASNGEPIGTIQGGKSAHNTIASLDGKYVYLGSRDSNYLDVASTETDQVVRQIGPLLAGVRPFTVNGSDTLAYTTETEFLGFQVSSILTGKVLYTVEFPGLSSPYPFEFSAPSHGITLTPDEQRLYVFDAVAEEVRVFDVSGVPARAPVELAPVKIASIAGEQNPCGYDCAKSGWLQSSLDGRFVYVGDSGSVIETSTDKVVANLPELAQTRVLLEIDWADGVPIATSTRYGLGYVKAAPVESPGGETTRGSQPAASKPAATVSTLTGALPSGGSTLGASVAVLSGLTVSPRSFVAARGAPQTRPGSGLAGARVSYSDSRAAITRFTVLRVTPGIEFSKHLCEIHAGAGGRIRGKPCVRYVRVGSFVHDDALGPNSLRLTGSIKGRALRPGLYELEAQPAFDGVSGAPSTSVFRITG